MPIAPVVGAALIGGAAAIGGGAMAASASKKAAKAQENAANTAAAAQERAAALALEAQKTGNAEAVAAAKEAAAAAQTAQDAATKAAQDFSRAQYDETRGQFDTAYGGVQDAYTQAYGQAQGAYDRSYDAAQGAYDTAFTGAQGAYDQAYQRQGEFQNPYIQSGLTAQNQIMQLMGLGGDANAADYGQYAKAFGTEQFEQDPGYAFRQSEGMKALERSASARGGLLSGGALKGIQRFGQDLASQEYSNAFNRYQTERAARLGTLGNLSSAGQSASNIMTGAAGQYGSQTAGNTLARGQATAQNALNRGEATAGMALGLGQATAGNVLGRGNAMVGAAGDYYGNQGNLALAQGQNIAQNQYNIADAVSRGAQNIANAGSQSAYNVGNAQATGAMNAGAARASGYVGAANAFNNALGQVAGYATQAPMNNAIMQYYKRKVPGGSYIPLSDDG